ncbi:uncharacterized protein LOC135337927 [Halichondria panicea]|uniref:uncharacterized protein LOC135337927 n=1 Tax=Halichondria panicea TaxID=6063 RepID=UPI00312BA24C
MLRAGSTWKKPNLTMKIVLVVVACFAAVNCQDAACLANRVLNNPSLATCISANNRNGDFCQLSCINDIAALYNTCGVSPNPITAVCPNAGNGAAFTVAMPMMVLTGLIATSASLF